MLSLKTNLWVNVSVDVTFPENVEYFKRFKFDQKSLKFLICDKVLTVSQFVSLVWQTFIISSEKSICVGGGSKKCETCALRKLNQEYLWRHQRETFKSMTIFFNLCAAFYKGFRT